MKVDKMNSGHPANYSELCRSRGQKMNQLTSKKFDAYFLEDMRFVANFAMQELKPFTASSSARHKEKRLLDA